MIRWQPRSRKGMFVGFSKVHSSDIPLILNLRTGYLSPQVYAVFDDNFITVLSVAYDDEPPSFWNAVDLEQNILRISLDSDSTICLGKDCLNPYKLEERTRSNIRQAQLRKLFQPDPISQEDPPNETSNHP